MAELKQCDQLEPTYSSSVRIRDITLRTCQKRWTITRSGERGSGISVLVVRLDDDDDMNWSVNFIGLTFNEEMTAFLIKTWSLFYLSSRRGQCLLQGMLKTVSSSMKHGMICIFNISNNFDIICFLHFLVQNHFQDFSLILSLVPSHFILLYHLYQATGLISRVFTNGPGDRG